jgi:hypothetical protein
VLSLPKPIERLSRPVMATHAGVPRGLRVVFPRTVEVSRTRAKPRAPLAKIQNRSWRCPIIARAAWARPCASEQVKNRPCLTGQEQGSDVICRAVV